MSLALLANDVPATETIYALADAILVGTSGTASDAQSNDAP